MGQLYKINFPNGKAYIGITTRSVDERMKEHLYQGNRSRVGKALNKYGEDSVNLSILAESDDWNELCELENKAIIEHGTLTPNGYNATIGGQGIIGYVWTDEVRSRLSASQKIAQNSLATNAKRSASLKAKLASPEAREKMSKASKAALSSTHVLEKISKASRSAQSSPEYRKCRSEMAKARLNSDEERALMVARAKAATASPEVRKMMSERAKLSWVKRRLQSQATTI